MRDWWISSMAIAFWVSYINYWQSRLLLMRIDALEQKLKRANPSVMSRFCGVCGSEAHKNHNPHCERDIS